MKRLSLILTFTLFVSLAFSQSSTLAIGDKAPLPYAKMKDISEKMISLEDVKEANGTLVIFSCNTCPFVIAWEDRYPELGKLAKKSKIGMVLVNSNSAFHDGKDSFSEMKDHAKEKGYNTYYALDKDSKLANAFGAKTTPHVFLFDKDDKLVFKGAIDDNHKSKKDVKETWLNDALANLASGKTIDPDVTRATGCGIKR